MKSSDAQKRGSARGSARRPTKGRPARTNRSARTAIAKPRRAVEEDSGPDLAPAPVLPGSRKKQLRAQAHELEPLVHVGHAGLTAAVLAAVSGALRDHELIKVRLHEPEDKKAMAEALAAGTRAALCGLIGHTVILFKPQPVKRGQRGRRQPGGVFARIAEA